MPFALAWACADGARRDGCSELAGRSLVVGATAPSLHDLRSTPLAVDRSGLDILATLIDNALHQRACVELCGGQRFALTALALDLAAAIDGAAVSGWRDSCGSTALPSVWVVWHLADDARAAALQARLAAVAPEAMCGRFRARPWPDGGLHQALARSREEDRR